MIQKIFHIDKWWGRTIFIILTYAIFWCVFYGAWLVIPQRWYDSAENPALEWVFIFYLFIFVPWFSFKIPRFFIKNLIISKKVLLYTLHIVMLLFCIALFLTLAWISFTNNFSGIW